MPYKPKKKNTEFLTNVADANTQRLHTKFPRESIIKAFIQTYILKEVTIYYSRQSLPKVRRKGMQVTRFKDLECQ